MFFRRLKSTTQGPPVPFVQKMIGLTIGLAMVWLVFAPGSPLNKPKGGDAGSASKDAAPADGQRPDLRLDHSVFGADAHGRSVSSRLPLPP